jgi:aminopeptidase N
MVFQGPESLERATTHEVGHMWFYSLVGNNQARHPWLDEGLASWSQARGQRLLGWFTDLALPPDAEGGLGRPMTYWERHDSSYFAGVYAQGVQALDALGAPGRVDCALRHYVARNAYGIAGPPDLVAVLARFFPRAPRVLARFGVHAWRR